MLEHVRTCHVTYHALGHKGVDLPFHPKNALACIVWLAGAGLLLVKISAEADHYYRSCGHMCQGQVYPLS